MGVATALGLLLGMALVVPRSEIGGPSPPLRLSGQDLPAGANATDIAIERAERLWDDWFNLELPGGIQRRVHRVELGVTLDRARLRRLIHHASKARAPSAFPWTRPSPIELLVPVWVDRKRASAALLALKEEFDQPATEARLDVDSGAVTPERVGRRLDVDRSLAALEAALERGASAAALCFLSEPPQRHAGDLANVRHDVRLGAFETSLDTSAGADDRTFNLRLAASELDGRVLSPRAVFDFNAVLGPRDESHGYRVASLAALGEPLDGSGSSTSQLSGTLHAAALFAGLDVVEHHPPQRPGAIDLGLDAAVAYPDVDLRLKNPYDFPVVLRATLTGSELLVEVRGPERRHTIRVVRKLDRAIPFIEIENVDETLERGVRVVAQRGVPGIELHRYRIRRDGAHAVRELSRLSYPPTPQRVRVGSRTGAPFVRRAQRGFDTNTAGRPPPDASPPTEYLADELLVVSQGDPPEAELSHQRIPGRSAVPGWSQTIGEPVWNSLLRPAEEASKGRLSGDFLPR